MRDEPVTQQREMFDIEYRKPFGFQFQFDAVQLQDAQPHACLYGLLDRFIGFHFHADARLDFMFCENPFHRTARTGTRFAR